MHKYSTDTVDTCWKDSIACILEINPRYVPDFVKLYKGQYLDETRKWLAEKYGKGLVYIPSKNFMETGETRNNPPVGPSGFSIGLLSMVDDTAYHALICFNGGVIWDNGDDRSQEYNIIMGYYVIYDLEFKGKRGGVRVRKKKSRGFNNRSKVSS